MLQERGLIARVGLPSDRARFDARTTRHHHFVCVRCGATRDFHCPDYDALPAPASVNVIGVPGSIRVEVQGVCHACGAKGESTQPHRRRRAAVATGGGEKGGKGEGRPAAGRGRERRRSATKTDAKE